MTWLSMTRSWRSTLRPYLIQGLPALECGLSIMSSSSDLIAREDLPSWALSQDFSFDLLSPQEMFNSGNCTGGKFRCRSHVTGALRVIIKVKAKYLVYSDIRCNPLRGAYHAADRDAAEGIGISFCIMIPSVPNACPTSPCTCPLSA